MTFLSGILAGLISVGALFLTVVTLTNPYNDLARVYARGGAIGLGVAAAILWAAFAILLRRPDRSD